MTLIVADRLLGPSLNFSVVKNNGLSRIWIRYGPYHMVKHNLEVDKLG